MIRIHNFPRGARGVRVFWVCEEMGLPYETAPVTFPPSAAYLALNPLGSVPFLEDEGVAINESVAMMLYIAQRYGPTPLLPVADGPALAKVLQLTVFSEASLGGTMNPLMAARFAAPDADKDNWSVRTMTARAGQFVGFIEDQLGDRDFLVGDDLTLADIALGTTLGIWRGALNGAIPDTLAAWRERLAARPAYGRAQAAQAAG
jgi:glutathione S-transferase